MGLHIILINTNIYNYNNDFTSCFGYNDIYVAIKRTTALITDSSGQNYFTISNGGYCTKFVNGVLTDSGDILGGGGGIQSYVGMIIYSSTFDTNEKVVAVYGGITWTKIENVFLLGQGSSYSIRATGGEATHTLTVDEMPSHNHTFNMTVNDGGMQGSENVRKAYVGYEYSGASLAINNAGGGQAHNNMPPYRVVYIWERTA